MTALLPYVESGIGALLTFLSARSAAFNSADSPLLDRLTNSAVATFGFWLLLSSIPGMLPVVMQSDLEVKKVALGEMWVSLTGTKVQDCEWISTEAFVISAEGITSKALLSFSDPETGTRPVGRNNFGVWRVQFSPYTPVRSLKFRSYHECGHRWPVMTEQGPFSIPDNVPYVHPSEWLSPSPTDVPGRRPPIPAPPVFPIPNYSLVAKSYGGDFLDPNRNRGS